MMRAAGRRRKPCGAFATLVFGRAKPSGGAQFRTLLVRLALLRHGSLTRRTSRSPPTRAYTDLWLIEPAREQEGSSPLGTRNLARTPAPAVEVKVAQADATSLGARRKQTGTSPVPGRWLRPSSARRRKLLLRFGPLPSSTPADSRPSPATTGVTGPGWLGVREDQTRCDWGPWLRSRRRCRLAGAGRG